MSTNQNWQEMDSFSEEDMINDLEEDFCCDPDCPYCYPVHDEY